MLLAAALRCPVRDVRYKMSDTRFGLTAVNSQTFYQTLLEQLASGPVALATVVSGDAEWVGAKLLIWGDAETAGSLPDATATQLISPAFEVMKTGLPQNITLEISQGDILQVWLARWQGAEAITITQAILTNLQSQRPQRLVIPLVSGQSPYVIEVGQSLRNLQGQNAYIEEIATCPI